MRATSSETTKVVWTSLDPSVSKERRDQVREEQEAHARALEAERTAREDRIWRRVVSMWRGRPDTTISKPNFSARPSRNAAWLRGMRQHPAKKIELPFERATAERWRHTTKLAIFGYAEILKSYMVAEALAHPPYGPQTLKEAGQQPAKT